jgi:acyl-CoA thioester hydrolase
MNEHCFYHPIEVRYGDIDPQGHVNNVAYFAYMEQARAKYLERLGLWGGTDFLDLGIILAEASCRFLAPLRYGQSVEVGVSVIHLGKKSFEMAYTLRAEASHEAAAQGKTVQVAFDYRTGESVAIPAAWRQAILAFEGLV